MAKFIHGVDGQSIYQHVVETVRSSGRPTPSRGGDTLNLEDVTVHLESPLRALPLGVGRKLDRKIAAAEALQLIGGFSNPAWLLKIAPQFEKYVEYAKKFSETGDGRPYFHGAYGTRVEQSSQLLEVALKLKEDPNTRQAVVTLWDPELDNEPNHLDYPCTVAFGFSVSKGRLNMRTTMRSNDVWLGLPYDLFQFTQLQLTMCNALAYEPGTYTHTAWSMHLYVDNLEASYALYEPSAAGRAEFQPAGLGRREWAFAGIQQSARYIALQPHLVENEFLTQSERWYARAIHGDEFRPADLGRDEDGDGEGAREAEPVQS